MADEKGDFPFAEIKDLEWCDLEKYRRVLTDLAQNNPCRLVHNLFIAVAVNRSLVSRNKLEHEKKASRAFVQDLMEAGPEVAQIREAGDIEVDYGAYYKVGHTWHDGDLSDAVSPLSLSDIADVFDCIDGALVDDQADSDVYPADFALVDNDNFLSDGVLVSLNLNATDKEILNAVKDFLPAYRKALNARGADLGFNRFSKATLTKVVSYRLIEYFHINLWADVAGVKIKDVTLANYLFGGDLDTEDPVGHFAKTVKPFAKKFENPRHVESLERWAASEYKK